MKTKLFKIFTILIVLTMILPITVFGRSTQPPTPLTPPSERAQELPADILAEFKDGMPISEFLARNQGPVPQALQAFTDKRVAVIVEMDQEPLAALYAQSARSNQPLSRAAQQAYSKALLEAQAPVVNQLQAWNAIVISQYTKAYNGMLVNIPASQVQAIASLPGVKAVHKAPVHRPALENSVPLIRADKVVNDLGFDGTGVTIAVIDTGIDYTHAALGGSGDPLDYTNNDPDTIEITPTMTFPTAKVIGGYDFAGTNYNASGSTITETVPVPDSDPLDEHGHGTHVSSTAAGIGVFGVIGKGVAPAAKLYALKVFGADGSTNLTVDAIEWSLDPNKDGDLSDHVDVINMSLGSDYAPNDLSEPDIVASNFASSIGVVVVAAAGNAGDTPYITGSPAAADSAISVAASTKGYLTGPTVTISGTSLITQTGIIYQPPVFDNNTGHYTQTITATLSYVGNITTTDTLCSIAGIAPKALDGKLALIQRGSCAFTTKVNNAASLGAVGAVIFNHSTGGDSRVTMAGGPVTIPAGFIAHTNGMNLVPADGQTAVVSAENQLSTVPDPFTPADSIASFSSRGPRGFDSILKPEITAPGVAIFAAKMGSGDEGVSFSGTSMAAPHVAGVAALIRQAHPDWSAEQVKAAIMNTAVDLADANSKQVPLQGAGRVDAFNAVSANTFAIGDPNLVSLNWGVIRFQNNLYLDEKNITLNNVYTATKVYSVTWSFGSGSNTDGFSLRVPSTVSVGASPGFTLVPVDLSLDATQLPVQFGGLEEFYGFVELTNTSNISDVLRVPFYAVPQPFAALDVTDTSTNVFTGTASIEHTGPVTSSLWAYPLLATDKNEVSVGDEGDVRMFGMDYGWTSGTYGPIFVPAINTYGAWHTPQPYFAEFDLYMDVDEDGSTDFVDFNFNLGWWNGGDDTDGWIVVQVDQNSGYLYLGSPYYIYADYNSGFMEWYLPAAWQGMGSTNSDFDYTLYGFDYAGSVDVGGFGSFDYAHAPLGWSISGDPGPADPTATASFWVADRSGYNLAAPQGLMIVDYNGKAGTGQAYAVHRSFNQIYLPLMAR